MEQRSEPKTLHSIFGRRKRLPKPFGEQSALPLRILLRVWFVMRRTVVTLILRLMGPSCRLVRAEVVEP